MIGYDNAAGACLEAPGLESGHWYLTEDMELFIVPNDEHGHAEIEGPDGPLVDALNAIYRGIPFEDVEVLDVAAQLGLTYAFDWQRRFDATAGYYTV